MELTADLVIRLMAVGASLLLLTILTAGSVRLALKIPLAGLVIGGAAYLINTSDLVDSRTPLKIVIDLVSIITPLWIWLFARKLFERDPVSWLLGAIATVYLAGWSLVYFIPNGLTAGFYVIHIISLCLIADLIYVAISGLGDDLIQRRRLIRIYLPILVGLQTGGILTFELIFGNQADFPIVEMINGLLIFALVLFSGLILLRTDSDLLIKDGTEKPIPAPKSVLSPAEIVLKDKLDEAMSTGYFREAGLTIQTLAEHLETPEHRLRALINQKLDHRNFSSFLNGYRIKEAKEKLADRELVDLPILTIAMDLGYNSLAPFNRAFRAETGQTPSDFRKSAIDQN